MVIRRETPADVGRIDEVQRHAFAGPVEADLVPALRADAGWVPAPTGHAGLAGAFRYAAPFEALG